MYSRFMTISTSAADQPPLTTHPERLVLSLGAAWATTERTLGARLGSLVGLSLSDYRILHALSQSPNALGASRIDLARQVGLTASGVTRALQPLERIGCVATTRDQRDARLTRCSLTDEGQELVANATEILREAVLELLDLAPKCRDGASQLVEMLSELANH